MKSKTIAMGIIFLAMMLDIITYFILVASGNGANEANPIKVLFGEQALILIVFPASLAVVFLFNYVLKKAENNYQKRVVYLFAANVVYAKVLASVFNVMGSLQDPTGIEPAKEYLLFAYFATIFFIFVSPLMFNLGFHWLSERNKNDDKVSK